MAALREEERTAEQERAALVARVEALNIGLDRKDGSAALLAATDEVSGLLGSVAAILTIEPGAEAAIAAALGAAADAVAVELGRLGSRRSGAAQAQTTPAALESSSGAARPYGSAELAVPAGLRHVRRRPGPGARADSPGAAASARASRRRRWCREARALIAAQPDDHGGDARRRPARSSLRARRFVARAEPARGAGRCRRGRANSWSPPRTGASACASR